MSDLAKKPAVFTSATLQTVDELLKTAETALFSQRTLEAFALYDQVFARLQLDLPFTEFSARFREIFAKIANFSINFLNDSRENLCFSLLSRCESVLLAENYGDFPDLRSLVLNHLACYYRRAGNIEKALQSLEKAKGFFEKSQKKEHAGLTHLNFSAVFREIHEFFAILAVFYTIFLVLATKKPFLMLKSQSMRASTRCSA